MTEDERLREALVELERLRAREARALRESRALLEGLERVATAGSRGGGVDGLVEAVARHLGCGAVALLRGDPEGRAPRLESARPAALSGLAWAGAAPLLEKRRRIADLDAPAAAPWRAGRPEALAGFRALLSAPVAEEGGPRAALLCLDAAPDRFSGSDLALLERMAQLAAQALSAQAMAERNALLAAVIDGSAASIAIADAGDPAMPLVYVNPAFERLTGYRAEDAVGANCRFLSDEPADSPERRRLRTAVAERSHGRFELRNRRADGSVFWNQLSLYPVIGGDGAARFLVATQIDVSDRRAVETERDAARRRLEVALSSTSQGFLLIDAEGRIVFANESYRGAYDAPGLDWSEGADFAALWAARLEALGRAPEAARAGAADRLAALYAGPATREERLADGRVALVEDRPTGDGGALSLLTDITSLKAAEELLAQRAAAIDAAQDGIALTDPEDRFVYMNPAHRAMFGIETEAEALGRSWSALYTDAAAAELRETAFPALERAGAWRGEALGLRRDGTAIEQELSLTRLAGGGIVCVTRDVSERRRAERERMRLRDQLQVAQRQEAIGQLAAGIAHDFNNLLSAISGSAALIRQDLAPGAPAIAHAERIVAATGRAAELISRLLDVGARRAERRETDLGALLADAADLLRASSPKRVDLRLDLPEAPLRLELDPTDILQIVLNLGINARDAIGPAQGEIALALRPATPEDLARRLRIGHLDPGRPYIAIVVADTGSGMSEEQAAEVFAPYFTTKGAAGTGLGLSVVASIVSANDAALALDTAPGEGARFTVLWPAGAAPAAAAPAPAAPLPAGGASLAGETVLVAEDAGPVLGVITAILERAGAEVGGCEDPRDALAALEEDPGAWSLLVTDYDMPGLTGAELAEAARRAAPDLPILLCSALPDWRGRAGKGALFDAAIGKPVEEAALLDAAHRAIARRRAMGESR